MFDFTNITFHFPPNKSINILDAQQNNKCD